MESLKFFALSVIRLLLEHLAGLVTETVEAARTTVNMMPAGSLLRQRFDVLDASATQLRTQLYHSRANPLTEELRRLDVQIAVKLDYIKRSLITFEKSPAAPKAAAAKRLLPVFKPFWDITAKALADQAAGLKELHVRVAAIGDNLEALTTLDLMDTWLAMRALDDEFNVLYDRRLKAIAAYTSATSIKEQVVTDYEAFCNVLVVTIATEPTEALKLVFGEVNEMRKKYAPPRRLKLDGEHTSVELKTQQPYFGGLAITPLGRVFYQTDTETLELEFTKDYEVSYKNNKEVGQATMIIHGKGKYIGKFETTFYIVRTN